MVTEKHSIINLMLTMILGLFLLQGCATEEQNRKMDETLNLYASTIRWSDFLGARMFYDSPTLYQDVNFDKIKTIKVTGYDAKDVQSLKGGQQIRQNVVIRYYDTNVGSEHQLIDHQVWNYNEDKEVWLLSSKMPAFN